MLKEVEEIEYEINKQLDTAIKNDNVSYKNSCLPPVGSRILTVMLECDFSISALKVLQGLLYPTQKIEYTQTHYLTQKRNEFGDFCK